MIDQTRRTKIRERDDDGMKFFEPRKTSTQGGDGLKHQVREDVEGRRRAAAAGLRFRAFHRAVLLSLVRNRSIFTADAKNT